MGKKGGHKGFGSVFFRKDRRRWVAQLDLGTDENGVRQVWRYYSDDPDDARLKLARAVLERSKGVNLVPIAQTVGEYLDYWLENSVKPNRATRTFDSYEAVIRLHLKPGMGAVPLAQLAPVHVVNLFAKMRAEGQGSRNQELTFAVLHSAIRQAVKWGLVPQNVCDRVDKPKHRAREKRTLSPEQAARLIAAVRGDRLEALYVAALGLGLRRGELLGLRWADVELSRGTISVGQQLARTGGEYMLAPLKTERSRRTLPLPLFVAEALDTHRARQIVEGSIHPWGLVFTTSEGQPLNGSVVSHRFREILAATGLPDLDLHDLRHTAGSLLAAEGTPASVIRDMLGHSQLSTTDRYMHSLPAEHQRAMDRMQRLFGRGDEHSTR